MRITPCYLIYHPERQRTKVGDLVIYHDKFGGNEDPYIWNEKFLHTFCHITQLKNEIGQINFWITGDKYPNFTRLLCDCVFIIAEKFYWKDSNHIKRSNPIVDNDQTFEHHYKWVNEGHHNFKNRSRYTLKADNDKSFQPQDNFGICIDILPFLNNIGISTKKLIQSLTTKQGSRPMQIDGDLGQDLYEYLSRTATIKIYGRQLMDKHPNGIPIRPIATSCCY